MKIGFRVLLVSTAIWLLVALVTFAQTWWIGLAPAEWAARLSLLEWGPWVLLSPGIMLFALAAPVTQRSWRWSILLHFACSLGVALAVNWMTMVASRHLMPKPGFGPQMKFMAAAPRPLEPGMPSVGAVDIIAPRPGFTIRHGSVMQSAGGPIVLGHGSVMHSVDVPIDVARGEAGQVAGSGPGFRIERFNTEGPPLSAILLMSARLTLPIYWLIVVGVHAWRHHRIALEREGRAVRAEREVVQARLAALQSQLQPHFLFNSLNAISAFITKRPAAADNMVCALSDLLRSVLGMSDRPEISLREELDFAQRYLAVHKIRFEDALRVTWRIEPEAMGALVPTLLLQPLIENALDHGLAGSAGELEVSAVVRQEQLVLTVTNRADEPAAVEPRAYHGTRIGLRNTRARLEALFGAAYRLDLIELPGGMRAEIELPLRKEVA